MYADRVNIIGVAGRDDARDMTEFVDAYGVGAFDHVADEDSEIWKQYGVTTQPAFVFIDGETGAAQTVISGMGYDGLVERIDALLA